MENQRRGMWWQEIMYAERACWLDYLIESVNLFWSCGFSTWLQNIYYLHLQHNHKFLASKFNNTASNVLYEKTLFSSSTWKNEGWLQLQMVCLYNSLWWWIFLYHMTGFWAFVQATAWARKLFEIYHYLPYMTLLSHRWIWGEWLPPHSTICSVKRAHFAPHPKQQK